MMLLVWTTRARSTVEIEAASRKIFLHQLKQLYVH